MNTSKGYEIPIIGSSTVDVVNEYEPTCSQGAQQAGTEGHLSSGRTSTFWILLPHVHFPQENWGMIINH